MQRLIIPRIILATLALFSSSDILSAALLAQNLRCEYRMDPLGVDEPHPRLSWELASEKRDQSQAAYRVLVASTKVLLDADSGDLWDSGKISGDQSIGVAY